MLASAREEKLEPGKMVRLDSTVTAALMHEPSDSSLLWDGVRFMVRLLKAADALIGGAGVPWRDHRRAAKKRARAIKFTRGRPNRVPHYRELVKLTRATLAYLDQASTKLTAVADPRVEPWQAELHHYRPLIERIIWRLFEPHADIIVKGSRDVEYGHKLNLITGRSGLILDVVIETGNPADSERFLPMGAPHHLLMARRRDKRPPMAALPAVTISAKPRLTGSKTWPSTRRPACASKTWPRAAGSITSYATSALVSKPASRG